MPTLPAMLLLVGSAVLAAGVLLTRASGGWSSAARRLGAAREAPIGDLVSAAELPSRPVRVVGRIRCQNPLVSERDDRLVAVHRDVEVQLPDGTWRTIERLRESRGFDLWDHAGTVPIDPARAAEPLVAIPHVWRGSADELTDDRYRSAIERLEADLGPISQARSLTRMVSVVERLQVLAQPRRDGAGSLVLEPPRGGYVISALDLDAAMRLLAGPRRRMLLSGVGLVAAGAMGMLAGLIAAVLGLLAGG
jgi:hypothetical protein